MPPLILNDEATAGKKDNPNPTTKNTESISYQCALLDLPLELRLAIYRFALETDTEDKETKTPVLQIGERRALRRSARNIRINRYTLMNFTKEHLALFGICIQSRSEIQTLMPSSSYHFTSADALGDFSCVALPSPLAATDGLVFAITDVTRFVRRQRKEAGATPNPCCKQIAAPSTCYDEDGNTVACSSPDEYPYASALEGGQGSIEYGTYTKLNVAEGGCGGQPCRIKIAFSFVTSLSVGSPFCVTQTGPNDGYEWTKGSGQWQLARRVPLELRREFLLDNGERVIVRSTDPDEDWYDELFVMGNSTARVVRELFGQEKSPPFRPELH
ncbi:hypothetical protein E4T50_16646 [Aureobasidium sp. EXF-12298]|nr:hypothetical protein E4T50_16646 [Aureobasidium sp. EXF-12298]KAI4775591.1 hypothetical protein E4T52_09436 [Aureobasidium sp. EXF-3400]